MKKKVKFIILWLVFFGSGVLLLELFGTKLRGPIIDSIFIGIGFLILIVGNYYFFRGKKPFLFIILGQILIFGGYFFARYFLFLYHPELSVVLTVIFIILGAFFTLLGAFYSFMELFRKKL